MHELAVLVTCEHAVNTVPAPWAALFEEQESLLTSHRGWDPGARELALSMARELSAPCIAARVSRLLVDHNRSPHNRFLWSDASRALPAADKSRLLKRYYEPFRRRSADWIAARHSDGQRILHLSVHTFAPVLDGRERGIDIGILYDPQRPEEASYATAWKTHLKLLEPCLRVRLNAPYRGRSDCHLSTYRAAYASSDYAGIEFEVNQALVVQGNAWRSLKQRLIESLRQALYPSAGMPAARAGR